MIFVPLIELMVYALMLSRPTNANRTEAVDREAEPLINNENEEVIETREISMREKITYIPKLMIYFIPLALVYFFEYFINQGLVRFI